MRLPGTQEHCIECGCLRIGAAPNECSGEEHGPSYTQADLDRAVAEAVEREREELSKLLTVMAGKALLESRDRAQAFADAANLIDDRINDAETTCARGVKK